MRNKQSSAGWVPLFCINFYPTITLAQSCSTPPFAVQLRNCTFASGTESWGNLLEVGSPPQRVCLVPSTVINSTLLSQKSLCAKSNTLAVSQCESLRGGFFNENSSTTWTGSALSNYNDTRSNPTWDHFNAPGITKVGWDTLKFPGSTDVRINGAGLALNQYGNNSNAGMIGLGKSSVFLDDAVHQNKSPSRTWSLDSGSQSLVKPRNGELVIGGYNKGRLDGSFRWENISNMEGDRPCPLRTIIREMSVLLPNGTSYPLKSSAEDITACIEPYDNLFRFTTGMLLNWKQITGFNEALSNVYTNPSDANLSFTELGLPYTSQNALEWSLTITLDSGYSTTLPHYEMQKPLQGWNVVGEKQVVPGITNVAILNAPTGQGEVPTLGKIFLSRSYLAVDYPGNRFGLAEVLTEPGTSELVALGCNTNSTSTPAGKSSSKFPVGAIVGVVIGGVALLLLAIFLFIFLRRRSQQKKAVDAPVYDYGMQDAYGAPVHDHQTGMQHQPPFSPSTYHSRMKDPPHSPTYAYTQMYTQDPRNQPHEMQQQPPPQQYHAGRVYEVPG